VPTKCELRDEAAARTNAPTSASASRIYERGLPACHSAAGGRPLARISPVDDDVAVRVAGLLPSAIDLNATARRTARSVCNVSIGPSSRPHRAVGDLGVAQIKPA
jgi:hypothetical protein